MRHPRKHWLRPPGPIAPGLRIGLLGGSFNPAHDGHVHVSEVALKRLGLDYVWWLVAPQNPLKPVVGMAPLRDRIGMAQTAAAAVPRVLVMDIEDALGTRYTIDTVSELKKRFPQLRFVWLMGSDNLDQFRHWRRWPEIAQHVPIAIVMRPGTTLAPLRAKAAQRLARMRKNAGGRITFAKPPAFIVLDGPRSAASASAIRAKSQEGEALVGAIPSW